MESNHDGTTDGVQTLEPSAGIGHLFCAFSSERKIADAGRRQQGTFNLIISNPPYIPINEKEKLGKNVSLYEPHIALFVPAKSPLIFYEKIAAFGSSNLRPSGKIYLETHEDYAQKAADLFRKGYETVTIKKDMYGKERMIFVTI